MILEGISLKQFNTDEVSNKLIQLIDSLALSHHIDAESCLYLLNHISLREVPYLMEKARMETDIHYGKEVYFRGLIEITNICSQACFYCGLQSNNTKAQRYRMSSDEILETVEVGHQLGFRSFVWQGGEDSALTDEWLCVLITEFKERYPDSVVTLSVGERSRESYQKLFDAGFERYLIRHESASKSLYEKLHPSYMSYDNRMECLKNLKAIGYWTGTGFLINPPYQTNEDLVQDLMFVQDFQPHMCGIGPFIPHPDTKFKDNDNGTGDQSVVMMALVRLLVPEVLLPATTALATVDPQGRLKGLKAGGNVVMPNLTPANIRQFYEIYAQKKNWGDEAAENVKKAKADIIDCGYIPSLTKGDHSSCKEK